MGLTCDSPLILWIFRYLQTQLIKQMFSFQMLSLFHSFCAWNPHCLREKMAFLFIWKIEQKVALLYIRRFTTQRKPLFHIFQFLNQSTLDSNVQDNSTSDQTNKQQLYLRRVTHNNNSTDELVTLNPKSTRIRVKMYKMYVKWIPGL